MKTSLALPLFFLGAAGHASVAMAQSPGTFTATGDMTTPRAGHRATLLLDGRVLIAGGVNGNASAELYSPSTGTFTATGNMTTPRSYGHTATLLPNGKVLLAGGGDFSPLGTHFRSAEIYDPDTGGFTATGDMTMARSGHTATLLNNGKVLIAGGSSLMTAELYDPVTGTFAATGDLLEPSVETASLLPNGKVLITRSIEYFSTPKETYVRRAELYDPETGTFSSTGDMTLHQFFPAATLLTNGKVLFTGGDVGSARDLLVDGPTSDAELYDPLIGAFSPTGNMTMPRESHKMTLLPDGTALLTGGWNVPAYSITLIQVAELYDPVTSTFSATTSMLTPRSSHSAALLGNGAVLIAGGQDRSDRPVSASAELYRPAVLVPAPVLYSLSQDGRGQGAILHADTQQVVSSTNPAAAGEALEIYGTGLMDGSVIPPQVAIGDRMAEVLFFGKAPGFAGLNQVNVRVPSGIAPGPAVSVRMNYLGRPSNEVTIGVR